MDRDQFEQFLLAHGGDPDRWPHGRRDAALALISTDDEARRMAAAIGRVDRSVQAAAAVGPAGDLAARILAIATGDEKAIFDVTPAGIAGVLAGSLGLAGIGYAATAAVAGLIVPAALLDTVATVVASGVAGGF